jgi:hypothetical protein
VEQIAVNQVLQQFITIQLANHASGIVIIGDICGILSQKIANDLVNGVITLFIQSIEHTTQNGSHILLVIAGYGKLNSTTFRHRNDLLPNIEDIISQFHQGVKP